MDKNKAIKVADNYQKNMIKNKLFKPEFDQIIKAAKTGNYSVTINSLKPAHELEDLTKQLKEFFNYDAELKRGENNKNTIDVSWKPKK
jgi:hypothetical protein